MNLEYLRHGKALCGNVFRRFVETFNFHNDFISNLKGDADLQVVGGKVNVDRTDERHPVIRCQGCGGGGGGDAEKTVLPFDGKATKKETGGCIVGMEEGQVIDASGNFKSVNLEPSGIISPAYVYLYVIEGSSGSQRFVASDQTPSISSSETITMTIPLFYVSGGGEVTQYTRGRMDLNGASILGEAGGIAGQERMPASNKVDAKGETGSGLIVRSYDASALPGQNKVTIAVDVKDRVVGEVFALRVVNDVDKDGNATTRKAGGRDLHVFATGNIDIRKIPDLDVLKDIELKYDAYTHCFTAKKTTVNLSTEEETEGTEETIFTAAPHFQNENPVAMTGAQFEP